MPKSQYFHKSRKLLDKPNARAGIETVIKRIRNSAEYFSYLYASYSAATISSAVLRIPTRQTVPSGGKMGYRVGHRQERRVSNDCRPSRPRGSCPREFGRLRCIQRPALFALKSAFSSAKPPSSSILPLPMSKSARSAPQCPAYHGWLK